MIETKILFLPGEKKRQRVQEAETRFDDDDTHNINKRTRFTVW